MRGLVLFTLVIWVAFSSSYSQSKFRGAMKLFDRVFVDGFGLCGAICVAPNLYEDMDAVNETLHQCQNTTMDMALEMEEKGEAESFYDFAIKRQGLGDSRLCRWFRSVDKDCMGQLMKDHCHNEGIREEWYRTIYQVKAYVCFRDPPVLQCALHPDVLKDASSCVTALRDQYNKYFTETADTMEETKKQFREFYDGEIKTDNTESLYTAFKTLGTCVSTLVGEVSVDGETCSKVKDLIDTEVDNVIAYFNKTDMLQCVLDPELWTHLQECVQTFNESLTDAIKQTDRTAEWVEQFEQYANDDYQLLKDPLMALTTCTLSGINTVCGKKWTYDVVNTQLTLLDNIFNPKDTTIPEQCEAILLSGAAGTSQSVLVTMAAFVLLRLLTTS